MLYLNSSVDCINRLGSCGVMSGLRQVSRDPSSPKMNTVGDGSKSIAGMQQELAVLRRELQLSLTSLAATLRNYTSKLSQLHRELRE